MNHLPDIRISAIPHKNQRYNTCGDYFKKKGGLEVRISKMNSKHEFLVLIHELVEWYLTQEKGVTIEEIDQFDKAFEKSRKEGNTDEPGDSPQAPYYQEHQFSTYIEKQVAEYLQVNWSKYEEHVNSL